MMEEGRKERRGETKKEGDLNSQVEAEQSYGDDAHVGAAFILSYHAS